MKKYVSVLLAIVIGAAMLCSCGGKKETTAETDGSSQAVESTEENKDVLTDDEEISDASGASAADKADQADAKDDADDAGGSTGDTADALGAAAGDRITELYFISCVKRDPLPESCGNAFKMCEDDDAVKEYLDSLSGAAAKKLIEEVIALPDAEAEEGDPSFVIRIDYVENDEEKHIEKRGYAAFPENWKEIVATTNEVAGGYFVVSDNTELEKVDAEYIRAHCTFDEHILPHGVTLEDVIESRKTGYFAIYDPDMVSGTDIQRELIAYLFEYYGVADCLITELDEEPPKSSTDELLFYARYWFDDILYWETYDDSEFSVSGLHDGYLYQIVRYDCVQLWLSYWNTRPWDTHGFVVEDGFLKYKASFAEMGWETESTRDLYVLLDRTGKYLLLTDAANLEDFSEMIGRSHPIPESE